MKVYVVERDANIIGVYATLEAAMACNPDNWLEWVNCPIGHYFNGVDSSILPYEVIDVCPAK